MNPSLEASWRHPWRQDLHAGTEPSGSGRRGSRGALIDGAVSAYQVSLRGGLA
ncbi:hypothetical protein [Halorhodospira halochloris]|uniref:hypothetical protein n=1 Tax=Halorhodospira halochloris TaxID=1052 RepID=UPI0013A553BA|nr:hypothetical protein [Halorhodospira halochloris]